jgi:hypothetical protein
MQFPSTNTNLQCKEGFQQEGAMNHLELSTSGAQFSAITPADTLPVFIKCSFEQMIPFDQSVLLKGMSSFMEFGSRNTMRTMACSNQNIL